MIGDRSAGAVMRAQGYSYQTGADVVVFYGASITDADLVMTDGKSLEHHGVTPDELLLPTAADLAAKRDPVLARAAALVGVKLDPERAGSMFPIEWRKMNIEEFGGRGRHFPRPSFSVNCYCGGGTRWPGIHKRNPAFPNLFVQVWH